MGPVTQEWSPKHPAIDIACMEGAPIRAAHSGKAKIHYEWKMGNVVELYGDDGLVTKYSHLSKTNGEKSYQTGDVIGYCGNTGQWTSGPHLHFESNKPYQF